MKIADRCRGSQCPRNAALAATSPHKSHGLATARDIWKMLHGPLGLSGLSPAMNGKKEVLEVRGAFIWLVCRSKKSSKLSGLSSIALFRAGDEQKSNEHATDTALNCWTFVLDTLESAKGTD